MIFPATSRWARARHGLARFLVRLRAPPPVVEIVRLGVDESPRFVDRFIVLGQALERRLSRPPQARPIAARVKEPIGECQTHACRDGAEHDAPLELLGAYRC